SSRLSAGDKGDAAIRGDPCLRVTWKINMSVGWIDSKTANRVLAIGLVDDGSRVVNRVWREITHTVICRHHEITALGLTVRRQIDSTSGRAAIGIIVAHPLPVGAGKAAFTGQPSCARIVGSERAVTGQRLEI